MQKFKKGDLVQIIKGKDSGKKGKLLAILPGAQSALIEGLNLVKKHKRQAKQDQQGGILSIEAPVNISNLAHFCKQCNSPTRSGFKFLKDGAKSRICRSCQGDI